MKTIQDLKDWLHVNGYHAGLGDIIRMEQDPVYAEKVEFGYYINGDESTLADRLLYQFKWAGTDLGLVYWNEIHDELEEAEL